MQHDNPNSPFMKGPKRKRLAKACDACHKSKRRCDGTAPCSNCYYASKQCTYTDASGRPVPAPRPFKPDRPDPHTTQDRPFAPLPPSATTNQFRIFPNPQAPYQPDSPDDDHKHPRKRFRNERGNPMPVDDLVIDGPIDGAPHDPQPNIELDSGLIRELTNLFFTHCHPARAVIHKPTFSSALSHNRVPSHLLLAVCALAAPLSKQPALRTSPARFAGNPFAHEALTQMFDSAGRLVVEPDLAAAQALCILQMHDILTKEKSAIWSSRFHDLALQIVEGLGVHAPEHPTLTPVPSQEFVQRSIEREAIRRIFWLIHFLDVIASIYFKKPVTFTDSELRLRIPVDETSFELGVHSTLPEYLYLPAVKTQYASEFGHLIRILSIYSKMEYALDDLNVPEMTTNLTATLQDAEKQMDEWTHTLPTHLQFNEQNLLVQQSMFETSSNTGAWCWCMLHIYHASCALALNLVQQRARGGPRSDPPWALGRIDLILQMLGDRAKNSILMGAALWALVKYCKRDDPQIRKWVADYEESWGTKTFELVQDWRSHPSPPLPPQYPSSSHTHRDTHTISHSSHSHPSHPQPLQQSHNPHRGGADVHSHPHPHPHSHRRLSDVRNTASAQISGTYGASSSSTSGSGSGSGPNSSAPPATVSVSMSTRPPPHQHGSDASYAAANSSSGSNQLKRSPSRSPPMSYPLGRPPNSTANTSGSNPSVGRALQLSQPLNASSNETSGSGSGTGVNGSGSSRGNVGPGSGGGGGGDQMQGVIGKYGSSNAPGSSRERDRDGHPRWPHLSTDSTSSGASGSSEYSGSSGVERDSSSGGAGGPSGGGSGMNTSSSSSSTSQRTLPPLIEGLSLPSLKSSGLLDSWSTSGRSATSTSTSNSGSLSASSQTSQSQSQAQSQSSSSSTPRRMSPPGSAPVGGSLGMPSPHAPSHSHSHQHHALHHRSHSESADMRPHPAALPVAMPVGLPWLANESR